MRTQDEIAARIAAVEPDDIFGFKREVLIRALDFEHAKPFLKDGATAKDWGETDGDTEIEAAGKDYLEFAWGKADDHRGISAGRSVEKLEEYVWLLGRDDVVDALRITAYPQYGAPKLAVISRMMKWPRPVNPELDNMAAGLPCRDDCDEGCGT